MLGDAETSRDPDLGRLAHAVQDQYSDVFAWTRTGALLSLFQQGVGYDHHELVAKFFACRQRHTHDSAQFSRSESGQVLCYTIRDLKRGWGAAKKLPCGNHSGAGLLTPHK